MHSSRHFFYFITVIFASLLLTGCIVVDDFGDYWNKGIQDNCINDIILSSEEEDNPGNFKNPTAVRVLDIAGQHFVMIRDHPEDKGGNIIRFKVKGGEYISYRLNEDKRAEFLQDYPQQPDVTLTSETVTIKVLNEQSASLLAKIAGDESYWLEVSREPYNPSHRPDCKGDNP